MLLTLFMKDRLTAFVCTVLCMLLYGCPVPCLHADSYDSISNSCLVKGTVWCLVFVVKLKYFVKKLSVILLHIVVCLRCFYDVVCIVRVCCR